MVYFAAKSEIPSETVNGILALQTKNGQSVQYTNLSWDSITGMQKSIATVLKNQLIDEINRPNAFAIMLDADLTVDKYLSICARYIKGGKPVTQMLYKAPVADGKAYTIVNCVTQELNKMSIVFDKSTSLATDG